MRLENGSYGSLRERCKIRIDDHTLTVDKPDCCLGPQLKSIRTISWRMAVCTQFCVYTLDQCLQRKIDRSSCSWLQPKSVTTSAPGTSLEPPAYQSAGGDNPTFNVHRWTRSPLPSILDLIEHPIPRPACSRCLSALVPTIQAPFTLEWARRPCMSLADPGSGPCYARPPVIGLLGRLWGTDLLETKASS
jgi:hypothetical protein